MLPLKLVRSLVLGETINNHPHILTQNQHHHHAHTHDDDDDDSDDDDDDDDEANEAHATPHHQTRRRRRRRRRSRSKTPAFLFLPTKEIIIDTYRLATIARDLGMDLYPTPSLSHIIFSTPTSTPSSSSPSTPSSFPSTCSFSSSSASWSLLNDAVPIPFPSLATAPLTHLRHFVNLSARAFKLVFFNSDGGRHHRDADGAWGGGNGSIWDCCSVSLYSRVTGDRIASMEGFCRALAGKGWTFFKTKKNPSVDQRDRRVSGGGGGSVYLFRKVDVNRVRVGRVSRVGASDGACRVRELRLPHLDFGNAPLRILQYILLMTDDIFCLA